MPVSAVVDTVIGLSFAFFVLSLAASAIAEWVATVLQKRSQVPAARPAGDAGGHRRGRRPRHHAVLDRRPGRADHHQGRAARARRHPALRRGRHPAGAAAAPPADRRAGPAPRGRLGDAPAVLPRGVHGGRGRARRVRRRRPQRDARRPGRRERAAGAAVHHAHRARPPGRRQRHRVRLRRRDLVRRADGPRLGLLQAVDQALDPRDRRRARARDAHRRDLDGGHALARPRGAPGRRRRWPRRAPATRRRTTSRPTSRA